MHAYAPWSFVAGVLLVHAISTPAMAGSASAPLAVSATVIANCRLQSGRMVCTKGTALPRTEAVPATVSEAEKGRVITVTVNF